MSHRPENIMVHIDRLVLDGLPISKAQAPALQAAVEAELARLLRSQGIADEFRSGATLAKIRTDTMTFSGASGPVGIGRQIARTLHAGIANQTVQPRSVRGERHQPVVATVPRGDPT